MWFPIKICYTWTKYVTGVTCFYTVFIIWGWWMLYLPTCITTTNKIGYVFVYSWPVYCWFHSGSTFGNSKVKWRHLRYSSFKNHGITILVLFITTPSMMLKFHQCIQNASRPWSISVFWSGHPVWITLANLTKVKSLLVSGLIWLIFLKQTNCSDCNVYGLIF